MGVKTQLVTLESVYGILPDIVVRARVFPNGELSISGRTERHIHANGTGDYYCTTLIAEDTYLIEQ